jgi:hypothetical protein
VGTLEDFEGPGTTEQEITLWTDNINPVAMPDTVPIYYEPFTDVPALTWAFTPLGGGRVFLDAVNDRLQMDRAAAGASTRNLARLTVNLSAYNAAVDELVLSARCLSYEGAPDARDGFFFTAPGAADTLLFQNFESLSGNAPGDVQFWGDLYGRYRIHNPWAGDGRYVTFDSRTDNRAARNRMMLEVGTTGVPSGTPVTVSFRFHDHADENHSGATGDFVGWNNHGVIDGSVNVISDLTPGSYNDTQWFDRSVTFTPATMPNPLYVVFGQYGSYRATSFSANDGITLDNVMVSVPGDTLYTQIGTPNSTPSWEWVHIDLDDAAIAYSRPFAANYQIWLSEYGNSTVPNGGRLWDDVTIGRIVNTFSVPGWSHGPMGAYVDEWSPKIWTPVMGYSWVLQNPTASTYGNGDYSWLESPPVTIPSFVQDPRLQFSHTFATENRYDGGYVQISSDGGPWVTMGAATGLTYTNTSVAGFPGGAGMWIFTGSRGWQTETVNLDPYAGHTVRFRFVFGSDGSATSTGWALDNFRVYGTTSGYEVTSLQFDAGTVPSPFTYDGIDVWMSAGPDVSFTGAGEWDKGTMVQVANDATLAVGATGIQTLTLDTPYMLPPGQNLYIKIEQQDTGWSGSRIEWLCQDTNPSQMCRQAASDVSDPVTLTPLMNRPNLVVVTSDGNLTPTTGAESNNSVPLNNYNLYNDVEMIYLASELGTEGSGGEWIHGGSADDWEIDAPVFLSIDPPLVPDNLSNVAGNDLTVNGLYNPDSWCWLVSPAYEMPDPAVYDSVIVRFERCLRLAPNDYSYIFMGFGDTTTPPAELSADWHLVRQYDGTNMTAWDYEDIDITDEFADAWTAGDSYFFIRFVLDSGFFAERGGWNVDNIQFFAVPIL